jgi:Arc/MetJ-type ribon-helix-helix transcriptional regulator
MSIIPVEVTEQLMAFAEKQAAERGCASASEFVRSLLQSAAELVELREKIQVGLDEVERGECDEWHPGDFGREVRAMIKQKRGAEL